MIAGNLTGAGNISVDAGRGGNRFNPPWAATGGGGGGGRIHIRVGNISFSGRLSSLYGEANTSRGAEYGQNGTVVVEFSDSINVSGSEFASSVMVARNNVYGRLVYSDRSQTVNSSIDFQEAISISYNETAVDSENYSDLNTSAIIWIYNVTGLNAPEIKKDGVGCPTSICVWNDNVGPDYSFNVTGFTGYSVGEDTSVRGLTVLAPLNQFYSVPDMDFKVAADETLSYCKLTLDGWVTNYTMVRFNNTCFNRTEAGLGDGTYTVNFWCNDTKGNVEDTESATFVVDVTSPVVDLVPPTPADASFNPSGSIEVNATLTEDNLENLVFNWNGTGHTVYDDSLVLMFNLDKRAGLGENDTHVTDVSGYGNNGTVYNNSAWTPSGRYSGGYWFSSDNGGGWLAVDESPSMDFNKSQGTIMMWVNCPDTSLPDRQNLFEDSNEEMEAAMQQNTGKLYFYPWVDVGSWSNYIMTADPIPSGGWTHIAITWDYSTKDARIYVNGSEAPLGTDNLAANWDQPASTGAWVFARKYHMTTRNFNGSMDEVQVYNRSLSEDEILFLYNSNLVKHDASSWTLWVEESNLSDGEYGFNVTAVDALDHTGSDGRNVIVDTTPRSVFLENQTTSAGSHSQTWILANTTSNYSSLDTIVIHLYNETAQVTSNSSTESPFLWNITGLADGTYYLNAIANNTSGANTSSWTFTILLDTVAPSLTIESPRNSTYYDSTVSVNLSYSGADTVWWGNGTVNNTYSGEITGGFSEGGHVLWAWAEDPAGNLNTTSVAFTVEATTTTVTTTTLAGGGGRRRVIQGGAVWVNVSAGSYVRVGRNTVMEFTFGWQRHTLTVVRVYSNRVRVKVESEPVTIDVYYGVPAPVDLDGDGTDDIVVKASRKDAYEASLKIYLLPHETTSTTSTSSTTTMSTTATTITSTSTSSTATTSTTSTHTTTTLEAVSQAGDWPMWSAALLFLLAAAVVLAAAAILKNRPRSRGLKNI